MWMDLQVLDQETLLLVEIGWQNAEIKMLQSLNANLYFCEISYGYLKLETIQTEVQW